MSNGELYLCVFLSVTGLCVADTETVYGSKGSSIIFTCPYRKTSTNSVVWRFVNSSFTLLISDGNITIPSNPLYSRVTIVGNHAAGEYNLQLSDLRESDAEGYRCNFGLDKKDYKLELLAPPSSFTLQDVITGNKILATEGQSLTLRCTATGGKPPPLITISVGNDVPRSAEQTMTYTIPTLQRGHDKQIVYCNANSSALNSPLVATATLYLYCTPETPSNYTITGLSEFSITIQWDAGYNGGHEQTFYIEYRKLGSTKWTIIKIPNTQQLGRQTFTLTGLQDSTKYEIRMFAENVFNKSMPTDIDVIQTTSRDITSLSTEMVVGGVVGGLTTSMAVLAILGFVIIYKRKQGLLSKNRKENSERRKEDEAYEHISGGNINDEMSEPMNKEGVQDTSQQSCSSPPYESMGMKDISNVYDELKNAQQLQTTTYEKLGMKDNPDTYEELLHKRRVNTDQQPVQLKTYEELGIKDSLNTYDELSSERIVNTTQRKTKEEPHLYIEIIDPKVVTQSKSTVRQYKKIEDQDKGTNYEN